MEESKMNILIVDDNDLVRRSVRRIVESIGHTIIGEAENGKEAIDIAREHRNSVDIVILDHRMPEITGLDALPMLRILLPDARIIMYTSEDVRGRALDAGADDFFGKTCNLRFLIDSIN